MITLSPWDTMKMQCLVLIARRMIIPAGPGSYAINEELLLDRGEPGFRPPPPLSDDMCLAINHLDGGGFIRISTGGRRIDISGRGEFALQTFLGDDRLYAIVMTEGAHR